MIWNKVIAFLSMGRLALLPLAGFAEALSIYRREICNERHDLPLISNGIPLLSPAKLQIILQGDCRRTRRTDGKRRITWSERLLLDLKAGKSVDKTDGNPKMAAVAQSLGRPDVGHKEKLAGTVFVGHHVGALSAECLVGTTANGWAI